jgi:hypothetical protein
MMKLTNKHSLPDPIVQAIMEDDYNKGDGDYSVTELWSSPRIVQLEQQHGDEIEVDAIDLIWSLFGRAMHNMLSQRDMEAVTEKRLYSMISGKKVGGQFDRFIYHLGGIEDYKVTSVWHVMNLTPESDWFWQQNSYAHILRDNGYDVKYLRINALLRDWNRNEAKRSEIITIDLPLAEPGLIKFALEQRVAEHEAAKIGLPLCSDKDRWYRPAKWAVMKQGNKKATKIFDEEHQADTFIAQATKDQAKLYTEKRPGTYIRCEDYCSVAEFCEQWKNDPDNPVNILKGI